ncbi:uncharacterized protein LOC101855171 [Aplysia californica]|uniref:Uncharacterized protein LOC101855171 n=1 Tax=Aplysia californica TaxID=6500 RepID=A0ABM0JG64_APLCA|nr:uncharacterized protein LOC101855171 [Aplysia californica]
MRCLLLSTVCLALVVSVFSKDLKVLSEHQLRAYNETKILFDFFLEHGLNDPSSIRFLDDKDVTLMNRPSPSNRFSFSNCGNPNKEILVPRNVKLAPDPIHIPGSVTASGGVLIRQQFGAPLKVRDL